MPVFRPDLATADRRPLTADVVREICADVTRSGNLFVSHPASVRRGYCAGEDLVWEISNGRLLDERQTRERRQFETWGHFLLDEGEEPPAEPTLAVRFAADDGTIHVTRSILQRAHEAYAAGQNVVESRAAVRWQRELVGTVDLKRFEYAGHLRDELACLLFQAVVGTSRLPLTSIEAPLPEFSLGRLGYFYCPAGNSLPKAGPALVDLFCYPRLAGAEYIKVLELAIRATPTGELEQLAASVGRFDAVDTLEDLRAVFNGVSLSPYTDFAVKVLQLLRHLVRRKMITVSGRADFLSELVRQVGRHLTAYDLVKFHHRGANYPDALLLTDLLPELLELGKKQLELFSGNSKDARLLRRGIRSGLLMRLAYAGHAVPDAPTSPGENLRVLPGPYSSVPEEQIFSPSTRTRRLFSDEFKPDLAVVRAAFAELDNSGELQELGTALFLDRPFGYGKFRGEPDQTLLASHVLFSRTIAEQRLDLLGGQTAWLPDAGALPRWRTRLRGLAISGIALPNLDSTMRPGVVSLADAWRVAGDWMIVRTTLQTVRDLVRQFDFAPLIASGLPPVESWRVLASGDAAGMIRVFDDRLQPRIELSADLSAGYVVRGGVEMPAAGLVVRRALTEGGQAIPAMTGRRLDPFL
jgi:hypothetical protein